MTAPRPTRQQDARKRLIAAVHAAAKKAGLEEDARRDLMQRAVGKRSAADMGLAELGRVLDAINKLSPRVAGPSSPHTAKARALWWTLYWLGAIDDPSAAALSAFVKRQTGVARIEWLDHKQAFKVIEALKAWCEREGVRWPPAGNVLPPDMMAALAVWEKLEAARLMGPGGMHAMSNYAIQAMRLDGPHQLDGQWNEVIKLLGKRWRRHLAKDEDA